MKLVALVLAAGAAVVAAVVCLAFPLTSNPGPESAQVLGVVGGVALCLAQAARASTRSQEGFFADALPALLVGAGMIALFVIVTAAGGALRPSCSSARGYLPFFFLAAPVLVLHTALGTWVGRLLGRPGRATVAALLLEIAFAVWLFVEWYREPGFRVISHLFVVVDGDLLAGASMPPLVIAFRAGTLLLGVALLCAGAAVYPRARRSSLQRPAPPGALYAAAAVSLVLGLVAHGLSAPKLMPRRADMEARYSLVKKRGLLVVHADPLALRPKDVDAVLAEGTLWLDRIDARLGQKPQGEINVYLHADHEAEAYWTGASHVDFTFPWRREVHITGAQVPHKTLGHELAHAVAGELSSTLLHIPSDFIVFQHAAVIEGLAVALTPELAVADGLTLKEQAAAMKRAGLAPSTASLFRGMSFFTEPPSRAYVAAGAFIESLVAKSLPEPTRALAALYRTGSVDKAMGGDDAAADLVRSHDAMLDALPLPPDAAVVAARRFERPSILSDICTPEDADRAREVRALARTGEVDKALDELGPAPSRETIEDLLADAYDVEDPAALEATAGRLAAVDHDVDAADRTAELGDAQWVAGKTRDAMASWDRARIELLPFDAQRSLLAKRMLAEAIVTTAGHAPVGQAALDVLLAHTLPRRAAAFERLHYWLGVDDGSPADLRSEPRISVAVGRYIHARRMVQVGALREAASAFRRILEEQKLPRSFLEQSALGLGTALVKLGSAAEASEILIDAADQAERPAMRLLLRDHAERAARAANAPPPPLRITATSDPAWADRLLLGADPSGEM